MNRLKVRVGVRFRDNMARRDRARYGARVSMSVQSDGCTRSGRVIVGRTPSGGCAHLSMVAP